MLGIGGALKRRYRAIRRRLHPLPIRLAAVDRPRAKFSDFAKDGQITLRRRPALSKSDVFFTMGSCFAEEIRIALTGRGIKCAPQYREITFDPSSVIVDTLPHREHMNFYNTFTVRLQLEQVLGRWKQTRDDFWELKYPNVLWEGLSYQDPYRRLILAKNPDLLLETIEKLNASVYEGLMNASAFIFTFGMTEVFINKKSGRVAAQKPLYEGGGGQKETSLHVSTFDENLANVREIVRLVRSVKPDAPIILTVSPVAMSRTFQNEDIVTVNTESKSILRAVLGQVTREEKNVIYLPSFEFVTATGYERAYKEDRRHVQRPVVQQIVDHFFDAYFQ